MASINKRAKMNSLILFESNKKVSVNLDDMIFCARTIFVNDCHDKAATIEV
jgi:hypothetical protein